MVICSADTILARSVLFVMDNSNVALKNGEDWKGFKTPEKKKHKQIYRLPTLKMTVVYMVKTSFARAFISPQRIGGRPCCQGST